MWQCRVGVATFCAALLACACGKSELGDEVRANNAEAGSTTDGGGVATSGSDSTSGGAPSTSGGTAGGGTSGAFVGIAGSPLAVGGSQAEGGANGAFGGDAGEPNQAGGPSAAGAPSCNSYYHACGCGCCTGTASLATCVYTDLGQDLTAIAAQDQATKQDAEACATSGCSMGRDYFCCTAPPATNDGATYETSLFIGGIDRIRLHKRAADCSTFVLAQASPADPINPSAFPLDLPPSWKLESVTRLPCSSSAIGPRAIGAIGKFRLRVLGEACVVDAHLAAFFSNDQRELSSMRFDADGVPIDIPVAQCK